MNINLSTEQQLVMSAVFDGGEILVGDINFWRQGYPATLNMKIASKDMPMDAWASRFSMRDLHKRGLIVVQHEMSQGKLWWIAITEAGKELIDEINKEDEER